MDEARYAQANALLLERLPFVRDAWLETSRTHDSATTAPAVFYDDVLRQVVPQLVAEASAGSPHARTRLQEMFSLTEELCGEQDGVSLVEGGILGIVIDAAARALDLVLELMGPRTRELFELAWGWHRVG
jgi:hypothetical protein